MCKLTLDKLDKAIELTKAEYLEPYLYTVRLHDTTDNICNNGFTCSKCKKANQLAEKEKEIILREFEEMENPFEIAYLKNIYSTQHLDNNLFCRLEYKLCLNCFEHLKQDEIKQMRDLYNAYKERL